MPITTQQEEKSSKAGSRVRETLFPTLRLPLKILIAIIYTQKS